MKALSPFALYCMLLFASVAALEYLTDDRPPPAQDRARNTQESRNLLQQTTMSAYAADGKLTYRLQSPELWHFSDSGNMRFAKVEFEYYPQSDPGLRASAEKGTTSKAKNEIYLDGRVTLERRDGLTLDTRDVTVSLTRKVAHTDQPATLAHDNHTTQGVGMFADLDKNEIRLQSRTRTRYED